MPKRTTSSGRREPAKRAPAAALGARSDAGLGVAVASGPALYREVLCRALDAEPRLTVSGRASPDDDVEAMLSKARPRVLLFDYEALGPNGEGLIARLRRHAPETRILVLATRSGPDTVERVLRAGASGLVGKESDLVTVIRAIRAVAAGEVWANRRDTAMALERFAQASSHRTASDGGLTNRETEIVRWVAHGLRNKEIAQRLGIHEKTVKTHLNNIFRKLRVDSRVSLALLGAPAAQPKT